MRRLKCQMLKEVWSFSVDRKLNKVWQGTVPMVDFMFLKDNISFKLSLDKLQRAYCTERSTKEFLPTGGQKYSKTNFTVVCMSICSRYRNTWESHCRTIAVHTRQHHFSFWGNGITRCARWFVRTNHLIQSRLGSSP